jgi:hypothetical protein
MSQAMLPPSPLLRPVALRLVKCHASEALVDKAHVRREAGHDLLVRLLDLVTHLLHQIFEKNLQVRLHHIKSLL